MQAASPSVGHLKPFVGGRAFALQPDVLRNRLVRHVPTTRDEVATSSQMAEAPNQVGQPKATALLRNLVVPLSKACALLGRPPILRYDGYVSYNWKRRRWRTGIAGALLLFPQTSHSARGGDGAPFDIVLVVLLDA